VAATAAVVAKGAVWVEELVVVARVVERVVVVMAEVRAGAMAEAGMVVVATAAVQAVVTAGAATPGSEARSAAGQEARPGWGGAEAGTWEVTTAAARAAGAEVKTGTEAVQRAAAAETKLGTLLAILTRTPRCSRWTCPDKFGTHRGLSLAARCNGSQNGSWYLEGLARRVRLLPRPCRA